MMLRLFLILIPYPSSLKKQEKFPSQYKVAIIHSDYLDLDLCFYPCRVNELLLNKLRYLASSQAYLTLTTAKVKGEELELL